jgi:hypothetical protein
VLVFAIRESKLVRLDSPKEIRGPDPIVLQFYLEDSLTVHNSFKLLPESKRLRLAGSLFELGRIYERKNSPSALIGRKSRAARQLLQLRQILSWVRAKPATPEGKIGRVLIENWLTDPCLDPYCVFVLTENGETFEFERLKTALLEKPPNARALKETRRLLADALRRPARLANDRLGRYSADSAAIQLVYAFAQHFRELVGSDPLTGSRGSGHGRLFISLLKTFGECLEPQISEAKMSKLVTHWRASVSSGV